MSSYNLSSASVYPYNAIAYITVVTDGEAFRGTGVVIGPHTVLTAAHLVQGDSGALATSLEVYTGYNGGTLPAAQAGVTAIHTFSIQQSAGYEYQSSSAYDFAIIDFSTTFTSWMGVDTSFTSGTVSVSGYPAYPYGGSTGPQSTSQWTTSGTVSQDSNFGVLDYGTLSTAAGNSGGPLWVAENGQADVVGLVSTGGWAAQLSDSIWKTISNWETADSSLWTASPTASAAVSAFVASQDTTRAASGMSQDVAGIATTSGVNSVIGWQSANLPSGHNAIVLDGARSAYSVQVDASDQTVIHDIAANTSIVVDGLAYLVFNGAGAATSGSYDQVMIVEGATNAQDSLIARLYVADLGRQPDLPGLEAWTAVLDSGAMSSLKIAEAFVGSAEFAQHYGANLSDAALISTFYTNVLGRAADSDGANAWTSYLTGLEVQDGTTAARAEVLIDFANSQENLDHTSSWLVDLSKGGYADSGLLMDAATVINQGVTNHYYDLRLVDLSSIPSNGVYSYNYVTASSSESGVYLGGSYLGAVSLFDFSSNDTIVLADGVTGADLEGDNDLVYGTAKTAEIVLEGNNDVVTLASGATTHISAYGTNAMIYDFVSGFDVVDTGNNTTGRLSEVMSTLNATHTASGANLSFGQYYYLFQIGNVGDGSAAAAAAVIDNVYHPAGNGAVGELIEFIGQTSNGNMVMLQWGSGKTVTADTNGNGQVDAAELTPVVTLVGVTASTLTSHDIV